MSTLGDLLERYRPYLTHLAKMRGIERLNTRVSASDVVQETFLQAHQSIGTFEGCTEREFTNWITRILQNAVFEFFRRHGAGKRNVAKDRPLHGKPNGASTIWFEPMTDSLSPSQKIIEGERVLQLFAALESLNENQREAVRLRHLEGWPLRQIADHMGKNPSAVAGLIKRGLESLRSQLIDLDRE